MKWWDYQLGEKVIKILFTTTFNNFLYEKHGRKFINSFISTQKYDLFIGHEGVDFTIPDGLICYNLNTDPYLNFILLANSNIIPKTFGGKADWNDPVFKNDRMLRRWSLWFRKFATLNQCLNFAKNHYSWIIFCDIDILFKQKIPLNLIENYNRYSIFFHYGRACRRKDTGFESGFIGFNLNRGGREYLQLCFDCYSSGDFRKYKRWDDSYIFCEIYKKYKIKGIDLTPKAERGSVIKEGPFRHYIDHLKGSNNKFFTNEISSKVWLE